MGDLVFLLSALWNGNWRASIKSTLAKLNPEETGSKTFAEAVNGLLALSASDGAVNALIGVLAEVERVFNDVQHNLELGKQKHLQWPVLVCLTALLSSVQSSLLVLLGRKPLQSREADCRPLSSP